MVDILKFLILTSKFFSHALQVFPLRRSTFFTEFLDKLFEILAGWLWLTFVRQQRVSVAEKRMAPLLLRPRFCQENSKRGYIPPKTETKCTSTDRPGLAASPLDFNCSWFIRSSVITAFIQVAIQINWVLLSWDKLIKWQTYKGIKRVKYYGRWSVKKIELFTKDIRNCKSSLQTFSKFSKERTESTCLVLLMCSETLVWW